MGFLARLFGSRGENPERPGGRTREKIVGFAAQSGTTAHPTPIDAIAAAASLAHRAEGAWATCEARDPISGATRVVQYAPPHVNLCLETCDLQGVLAEAGLDIAAEPVEGDDVGGLWAVQTADHAAAAIDAVFRHHFGLGPIYEVSVRIEG